VFFAIIYPIMPVIVRVPPSPTGNLHVGTARTALFNYIFAKQQGGKVYLRLEDTDRARSKPEFERNILDSFNWLGLSFENKEPIRQSERGAVYQQALEKLLASGAAYLSKENHPETGEPSEVIRFKNPNQEVSFDDLIRGKITFDTTELGDFVIAKSLTEPLYHLAVVVDDLEIGVTHIIRGEDHISNTPRQILLIRALDATPPLYAHIPLILAPDRSKLSKRHGAVALTSYRDEGYLPEAMINFLATLGWSPQSVGLEQEVLSLDELIKHFDLSKVQKGGAIFDLTKLKWFNREYLKRWTPTGIDERLIKLWPALVKQLDTLSDLKNVDLSYFDRAPSLNKELLKNTAHLAKVIALLESTPESDFTSENIKNAIWDFASATGRAEVLWPMRVALTGLEKSPDPFVVAAALGKQETLNRLTNASKL
jgi:glutamyl-tRNA synthetase